MYISEFLLWCNRIGRIGSLGSTGTQVRSPARHGGLRIPCICSCGLGCNCSSDLIPGWETPYALGQPKKEKKRNSCLLIFSAKNCIFRQLIYLYLLDTNECVTDIFSFVHTAIKNLKFGVPFGSAGVNPTSIHEDVGLISGPT